MSIGLCYSVLRKLPQPIYTLLITMGHWTFYWCSPFQYPWCMVSEGSPLETMRHQNVSPESAVREVIIWLTELIAPGWIGIWPGCCTAGSGVDKMTFEVLSGIFSNSLGGTVWASLEESSMEASDLSCSSRRAGGALVSARADNLLMLVTEVHSLSSSLMIGTCRALSS